MGQEVGRRDSVGKSAPGRHSCKEVGDGNKQVGSRGAFGR